MRKLKLAFIHYKRCKKLFPGPNINYKQMRASQLASDTPVVDEEEYDFDERPTVKVIFGKRLTQADLLQINETSSFDIEKEQIAH